MSDPRPPKSPRKGKYVNIRIAFLNDTVHVFQVPVKGVGLLLWEAVVNHLQLLEADYFDLEYTNQNGDDCWLDKDKTVLKQIGSPDVPLRFCVKFYTPDPGLLEDELTRYLFALQIRKDLLRGELRCSENTAALLASYIVQGEIGDFDIDEYQDPTYLAVFKFLPEHLQTHEFMAKVMDYHKQHVGESPSEADLNLLDTARKVELYGVKMQPAKDHEGVSLNLAVAHLGVLVFQHFTKINTFSWAKVRKLSFKRKKFLIKLHADTYGYYKDTVEFFFETRDRCKLFWKRCIEHHAFFRCQVVAKVPRNKTRVVSRGSSFRYCGRTQKQLVEFVRENIGKRPQFERATSGRISSRSTSVTPKFSSKPSMHSSSADLHTSSGSRSSGSHILDSNHTPGSGVSRDHSGTPHSAMRVESVDVHSDSSMSGSRSLNSPRLEHGLSIDQDVIEAVNARTEGAMTDDEDIEDSKDDTYHPGREGISHVASDTKGAHSILSPEMNSPVRYVGIYSEVDSPYYHRDDGFVTPDVDMAFPSGSDRARPVSPPDIDDRDVINQPPPLGGRCQSPSALASHVGSESQTDSSVVSVCSDVVLPESDVSNQVPKPNLDLQLTNITSSSPSASSAITVDDNTNPSPPPPLLHQHQCKSSSLSESSSLHTVNHVYTTTPVCTTTSPTNIAMSASQNANDLVREKASIPVKSDSDDRVSSRTVTVQQPSHFHHIINTRSDLKKVSPTDLGQHQWQAKVKDAEVSPFASPSTPLSPQYKDSDLKRSLDASPSSCVTDIAESRQDHKVRHSSRVSSVDSSRTSPVADVREQSFFITPQPMVQGGDSDQTHRAKTDTADTALQQAMFEGEDTKGSSGTKDSKLDQTSHKKLCPNGDVVGAGLPKKDELEPDKGVSRKLSAGTDLIEDIPYILHRRLDGQKEETAVFKVSEADKIKRQRSASPGVKGAVFSCFPQKQKSVDYHMGERSKSTDRRSMSPEGTSFRSSTLPSSVKRGGVKNRPSLEKSPPMNRRFEFVNVHKLPSRTSYSSVDDTTSPSGEQEILKHLEQATVTRSCAVKAGDAQTTTSSTTSTSQTNVQDQVDTATASVAPDTTKDVGELAVCSEDGSKDEKPFENGNKNSELPLSGDKEAQSADLESLETPKITDEKTDVIKEADMEQKPQELSDMNNDDTASLRTEEAGQFAKEGISSPISDESSRVKPAVADVASVPISEVPDNASHAELDNTETTKPNVPLQEPYFETSKPEPCHGYKTNGASTSSLESDKGEHSSVVIKPTPAIPSDISLNTFGKSSSATVSSSEEGDASVCAPSGSNDVTDGKKSQRAPHLSTAGRASTSSTSSSSDNNQFLIDLPSPASALFYSDNESPPTSQAENETVKKTLTFSTFRPDPVEEAVKVDDPSKVKSCRWALHNVEEDEEPTDYEVIMEEGIVEKSALKKRTCDETDKPREPKRVSWHEDSDIQHSYHSDLSMTAQRSPVDECDPHLFGEATTPVDSGNILETLENLRAQNSESDMTNTGSSDSSSVDSDTEAKNNPKQIYFQYAASKGFCASTVDSGVGGLSEGRRSQGHESSPLESLEHLESMEGSGTSFSEGRFKIQDNLIKSHQDSSPLEPLEKLCGLRVDNFDDEGEADDEDDEPNFPPPPPILDIPEEMLVSYESDLPLPDLTFSSSDNLCGMEARAFSPFKPSSVAYLSDSENETKAAVRGAASKKRTRDPLTNLDFGDLVGDKHCTTSESESDFDAEEANIHLRRMSATNITPRDVADVAPHSRSFSEVKQKSLSGKSTVPGMKKISEKPQVLPKPTRHRQPSQGAQEGAHSTHSLHIVQKSEPLPTKPGPTPPPVYPKPQPPLVQPRPGPIRQPQMGKVSSLVAHGLSLKDRKLSAPLIGGHHKEEEDIDEKNHCLSRTAEIENIPEVVEEDSVPVKLGLPSPPQRSSSLKVVRQPSERSDDIDDLPPPPPSPPPPPPPFEDDEPLPPVPDYITEENGRRDHADDIGLQMKASDIHSTQKMLEEKLQALVVNDENYLIGTKQRMDASSLSDRHIDTAEDHSRFPGVLDEDSYQRHELSEIGDMANLSRISTGVRSRGENGVRAESEGSKLLSQDIDEEHKRKVRHRPTDTAYYIAKELLMTERTYKKDLEVLCVWFRNAVSCDPAILNSMCEVLFQHFDPIYNYHYNFLKEVEQRLAAWEGKIQPQVNGDCHRLGDLMLKAIRGFQELYVNYLEHLEETLTEVDTKVKKQRPFEEICRGFEAQKVCYLPLNTFFLRPGQRLQHFKLILERLVKHYSLTHHDVEECKEALSRITEITSRFRDRFRKMENLEKLMELQRDLLGLENLVHIDRDFIREGCLQKFSRKGYQQRMFFLFSDMLVYTSRTSASLLQFKVHGQLPLRGMTVEETDQSKSAVQNSFAIYAGNKYILVAASTQEEKDKWIEDINEAVSRVKHIGADKLQYPSLKSSASSSENVGSYENVDGEQSSSPEKPIQHRANTTMHVCWHRNTSVSMRDHENALKNQLSGYLLRKFKTSNGWQKLWVVFTNFCLFFYKTYQDDFPLASLPLLGYAVNTPDEEDAINKEHVFKLQFKNHVYFFRAESEYTFSRWMDVINSATHNARRVRLFSRLDSRVDAS